MRNLRKIRATRERLGISVRGLACLIGTTPSQISRIENGQIQPSEKTLRAICEKLDLDFDEILCGTGKVPSDVVRYIAKTPGVLVRLRRQMARSAA